MNDKMDKADIIFISIHIPTQQDGVQDIGILADIISNLTDKPIFIRTTVLPSTCDKLAKQLNRKIYFMPEFLSERTAYEDFCNQTMIFTGEFELLKSIFKGKKYIQMTNVEAEIAKYSHNVFGALKITYFNGIHKLSQEHNANYNNVIKGALVSGYINKTHTVVPGHDEKFGYGGKCLPKDINAFIKFIDKDSVLRKLLEIVVCSNEVYRGK
jgi:UDPglucose 6-dehydrogenase